MIEGFACGLERLFHFAAIEADPLLKRKRGWERLPDHTLLNKDLKRFDSETLAMYRGGKRLARLDRGFDSEEVMATLEMEACGYVIKLRLTPPLVAALATLPRRRWKAVPEEEGTEVAAMRYRAGTWTRERRVVVMRRRLEDSAQEDFWGMDSHEFAAYVTTLRWAPVDILHFYRHRGTAENYIKESKAGFAIDHIPTAEFYPNWAALVLKMIAYNLLLRFQRALCPESPVRRTAATFRRWFLLLPAQLINRSGQWVLKLPAGFPYQQPWRRLRTQLALT